MRFEINDKKKCDIFIHIFNNLKNFTDNAIIHIDNDKMFIQGMDNSHVCVYELQLDNSWFSQWTVEESQEYGICLPIFNKILHTWSDKQNITIYSENPDKLEIEFTSDTKGDFDKFFQFPLMDIDSELLCIPETDYECDITMESHKVKHIVDELACFNDTINLKCDEEKLCIDATSSEGSMKVVINMDDIESLAVVEDKTVEATFSIRYLAYMCQFHKLSENCTIHMSENIPIQLKYEINDVCFMKLYLAPKMNDE